jgi:hypothetical protein
MSENATGLHVGGAPKRVPPSRTPAARAARHRNRHHTSDDVSKKSKSGQRALALMRQFEAKLGGDLTEDQRLAVERAAVMTAIAEDARVRRLNGNTSISLEDLVRLDHASERALRLLGMRTTPAAKAAGSFTSLLAAERTP